MRKMAVCEYNPFHIGGTGRVANEFANMMADEFQVDIICLDSSAIIDRTMYGLKKEVNVIIDEKLSSELTANLFVRGLRFINRKWLGVENLRFLEYIYTEYTDFSYLISICKQYDVVIGMQLRMSIILGKISEQLSCKTIGWQHSTYDAYFNQKGKYYWNQHLLASKYLNKLFQCIVLTDADAELYDKYLSVKAKRIYNPNSLGEDLNTSPTVNKKKQILWVGRIQKFQKGIDFLLEITMELIKAADDSFEIIVVGEGADLTWLRHEVLRLGLGDFICCEGSTCNIEKYYKNAYILISTSRWEGFGLNIIEAMSFGLPIVAFDNSGPHEIINNSGAGYLISKYDIHDFAQTIKKLLNNNEEWWKMSISARRRSEIFSPEYIKKEWMKIL